MRIVIARRPSRWPLWRHPRRSRSRPAARPHRRGAGQRGAACRTGRSRGQGSTHRDSAYFGNSSLAASSGVDRSELLRDAVHRHLAVLSSENDIQAWQRQPLSDSERSLSSIADWGPTRIGRSGADQSEARSGFAATAGCLSQRPACWRVPRMRLSGHLEGFDVDCVLRAPAARFISIRSSSDAMRTACPSRSTTSAWRRSAG